MPAPTNLWPEPSSSSSTQVTVVASATAGAIVFVFILFAVIFFHLRSRQRKQELTDTLAREERKGQGAGGVGMLDGEGFWDSLRGRPPRIEIYPNPQLEYRVVLEPAECPPPQRREPTKPQLRPSPYPMIPTFLFPPRVSRSGSAFREEVWPPPRQESIFVDPFLHSTATDDLKRIVTDVMGPPTKPDPPPTPTITRASSASEASLPTYREYNPLSGAASPFSRRNSYSTIDVYSPTPVHSHFSYASVSASVPSLPSAGSRTTSSCDPLWPPTPRTAVGITTPPVSYFQRGGKLPAGHSALRPSTGDSSPLVKNWLERTPRAPSPGSVLGKRRAVSEGALNRFELH